ncbi:hypothetical protein TOPH_05219 [Tolypocladium ophioglossoides CBS 100239]|uniref:Uncharacterized protein n=1 Tax=Tolypocladium ophioglossoides (strain CBS 100239) TaxID=1163406 RepID=A0A0L0N835_TOLOC|nr:hypothetical protein TOPH_05219 [Tolypocladium ophioglossoides CBS 100239]
MGSAESKQVESRLQQATLANVNFPAKFSFWYKGKAHIRLLLGEDKSSPSHIISLPGGWYGELILYNGPTIDAEPVGVIRSGSKMGWHDCVELAAQPGQPPFREELRCHGNGWSLAYTFAISLGPGSLPERFEWRSSHSDEVKSLGEGSGGWKLVRLGNEDEIVAVAGEAKFTNSLTRVGAFQFVGRGASGEFGEAWAVMAVASFVRMWQRSMQGS